MPNFWIMAPFSLALAWLSMNAWVSRGMADATRSIESMLASRDSDELAAAFALAAVTPRAHPAAAQRVRDGLPHAAMDAALEALSKAHTSESLVALFSDLTRHRDPAVRALAVAALAHMSATSSEAAVCERLSDQDSRVREAAAVALSSIGGPSSQTQLARAVTRNIPGAAQALGRVMSVADVSEILRDRSRFPWVLIQPAFDSLLTREDLNLTRKLSALAAIEAQGTAGARAYLEGLSKRLSALPSNLLRAAENAAERMAN